jgi:amino acid transporter
MLPEINVPKKRVLSVFSLVMINIIAVDSLRSLPINAELGLSIISYYVIFAIFFFIPTALVAAECATGWPATGGLYVWVREAFGRRWGFITLWLQWIYNIVWYPTILAFLANIMAFLINPAWANNKIYLFSSVLILFWGGTLLNCFGMRLSSWISTAGAILGTLVPMVIITLLGFRWLTGTEPQQIEFTWHNLLPNLSTWQQLALIPNVLFGLIGMEMSAVHAEEVKNPQRDYPKALLYSTIIIFVSLICASLAIALVIPLKTLSVLSGLMDAFILFFNEYHMSWMIPVIAIAIILGGFSGLAAWIIGPTKGLLIAAEDGELPAVFSKVNRYGAPVPMLLLQGGLVTLLATTYVILPQINSAYWLLTDLTSILALLVYVLMFLAGIVLRIKHPDVKRTFKIPGEMWGISVVCGAGILTCIVGIVLGFLLPDKDWFPSLLHFDLYLLGGIMALIVPAFFLHKPALT